MSARTGGPAFPLFYEGREKVSDGITVRDYFAAAALPFAAGLIRDAALVNNQTRDDVKAIIARAAWNIADAMLAERDK